MAMAMEEVTLAVSLSRDKKDFKITKQGARKVLTTVPVAPDIYVSSLVEQIRTSVKESGMHPWTEAPGFQN